MSSYKQRAYIIHHHGSLNNCTPSDPRDLTRRAIEIFRKQADPDNEFLEEEIESLKRNTLKEFILRKGGSQDDITAKSKTELRAIARELHRKQVTPPPEMEWYEKCLGLEYDFNRFEISRKVALLFEIINMCYHLKDKLIVFSQSVFTLDAIEHFLTESTIDGFANFGSIDSDSDNEEKKDEKDSKKTFIGGQKWYRNIDYFRIDGSVSAAKRTTYIDNFNNPDDPRARLFLVSTKAGGIGTNLVGANRVVIFDSSWNPAHDVQSLFRVYRFGQVKDVYVYRFVGFGTMEEKIYERQVNKASLGLRVVDEQQIDRHYSAEQLKELYNFTHVPAETLPKPAPPKDPILGELLRTEKTKDWVIKYHQHDSLLEHRPEEQLSKEEIEKAWEEFDNEKKGIFTHMYQQQPVQNQFGNYPFNSNQFNIENVMNWQNLNTLTKPPKNYNKSNWVSSLSKKALETYVALGKNIIEDGKKLFNSRRELRIDDMIQLLVAYNPNADYMTLRREAHKAFYHLDQTGRNERDMYRMGLAIYKQCEQQLTHANYQELQQKIMLSQLPKGGRPIQPRSAHHR